VKITVFHPACGREVLVEQILESQGHCPWDGKPFSVHYTAVLAEALADAQVAGGALESALDRIAGMGPHLTIDEDTVIAPLRRQVERLNTAGAEPKASPA
jgi:hypothetical protein